MANKKRFTLPYAVQGLTTIYGIILQQSTAYCLNNISGLFTVVPLPTTSDYCIPAIEEAVIKGMYTVSDDRSIWPNGTYLCAWYNQLGATPSPSTDQFLGGASMFVINDAEASPSSPAASGAGGNYTLGDIETAIRIDIKDIEKAKFPSDDPTILKVINDGIDILHSILCNFTPHMFRTAVTLNLTVVGGYGPYPLDAEYNMKRLEWIEDQNGLRLGKSYRGEFSVPRQKCQPQKYFLEGLRPQKVYFDSDPDQAYTFTAYIIKNITRATALTQVYPLPDNTFVPMVSFCSYVVMNLQEYATMDEEKRINLFMSHLSDDLLSQVEDVYLAVDSGFPDGSSMIAGNSLDL